jgi:deoxycytidine triphosphate deaminase
MEEAVILISKEISERDLVHNRTLGGKRETTYDATVGEIIHNGTTHKDETFELPASGMVWVVSHERFALPPDLTGLATLRTTWTHSGILALNVGVVDPGWNGPLATAVVNFSSIPFEIKKGDGFLRVLFLKHLQSTASVHQIETDAYLRQIRDRSAKIPKTFLSIDSLAQEILNKLYGSSIFSSWVARIGVTLAVIALVVGVFSIFIPLAYGVSTEYMLRRADLASIKSSIDQLEKQQNELRARLK